jgi:hypothetical protein
VSAHEPWVITVITEEPLLHSDSNKNRHCACADELLSYYLISQTFTTELAVSMQCSEFSQLNP